MLTMSMSMDEVVVGKLRPTFGCCWLASISKTDAAASTGRSNATTYDMGQKKVALEW